MQILRSSAVFAANDTYYACTNDVSISTDGQVVRLDVTVGTASCGNMTFYAAVDSGSGTYSTICSDNETPHTFGPLSFSGAGSQSIELKGLNVAGGEKIKIYFKCSTGAASATVEINAATMLAASSSMDIGDIEVGVESIVGTHDSAAPSTGVQDMAVARAVGTMSAAVHAGDSARLACGLDGVPYARILDSTGAYVMPSGDNVARPVYIKLGDGTNYAAVIPTILSLKIDDSSVAGTATDVNSGNKSAGSKRVVIATDDVNLAAINTSTGTTSTNTTAISNAAVGAIGCPKKATTQQVAYTDSSARSTQITAGTNVYVYATTDCYMCFCGASDSATTSDMYLPANCPKVFTTLTNYDYIAAIRVTTSGTLHITPLARS